MKNNENKPGPNNRGIYDAMLAGGEIPVPPKPWRQLTPIDRSRYKNARAAWRKKHEAKANKKIGRWVRGIRKAMKNSKAEFSELIGVSVLTINRWEGGYGHAPSENPRRSKSGRKLPSNMQRLRNLESAVQQMKKEKLKF